MGLGVEAPLSVVYYLATVLESMLTANKHKTASDLDLHLVRFVSISLSDAFRSGCQSSSHLLTAVGPSTGKLSL